VGSWVGIGECGEDLDQALPSAPGGVGSVGAAARPAFHAGTASRKLTISYFKYSSL